MLLTDILLLLSGIAMALAVGAMLFFAAIVTPTVFAALEPEPAGRYLRALFPRYYLVLAGVAGLAALLAAGALGSAPGDGGRLLWPVPLALALVALGFLVARQVLTPLINAKRDLMLAGDVAAGEAFSRLHRGSVMLNIVQLLALVACLGWTMFG